MTEMVDLLWIENSVTPLATTWVSAGTVRKAGGYGFLGECPQGKGSFDPIRDEL